MSMLWVLALLAVVVAAWAMLTYNGLVGARNAFRNAFAQIDVQLHRRHDLIPNLVETAKAYLSHERETLEAVIRARNSAVDAAAAAKSKAGEQGPMQQLAGAENALSQSLGRLFALAEAYPDLKANQNMAQLSEELSSTENRVAFARQAYNDQVMSYNNRCEMFPGNLLAAPLGFRPAALLELDRAEAHKRDAPKVSFN